MNKKKDSLYCPGPRIVTKKLKPKKVLLFTRKYQRYSKKHLDSLDRLFGKEPRFKGKWTQLY